MVTRTTLNVTSYVHCMSYSSTYRCPHLFPFKFSNYNSLGIRQVSITCNTRLALHSNHISNPNSTEQCICDALTTECRLHMSAWKYSKKNGKAIPLQACTGPSAHEGGKVVSPTHRPPLPPRKDSWYSFLLEAESFPGS
jgi:hypothetical protein